MSRYDEIAFYYDTSLWSREEVYNALSMGYITLEELETILNN